MLALTWTAAQKWWRQALLVLAGVCSCAYALGVLWYVQSTPDIGLRCAFSPVINRVDPSFLRTEGRLPDLRGHTIVKLGGQPVQTWPHLLRLLRTLRDQPGQVIGPERPGAGLSHVRRGDEVLVRVDLRSPGGQPSSVWCVLGNPPLESLTPSILWFFLKSGLFLVGALVFWKRPTDRSAAQFYILSVVTLGAYMGGYHWSQIATQPVLLMVFMTCAVLLPAVSLHFYLSFPRPKPLVQRRPRATLAALYTVPVLFLVSLAVGYLRVRYLTRQAGPAQLAVAEVTAALDTLLSAIYVYLVLAALYYLACVASLLHSYWRAADPAERNQVKCIFFGAALAVVPIGYTLYLVIYEPDDFGGGDGTWPMFAASVCFTAAFAVSITRYRLMQLDQLLSSGVVYFLISFVAGLVYYAVVFLGTLVVGRHVIGGPSLPQALWVSSTALVLMVVLDLARSRFKKVLDRRFTREKYQLDRTLRRMGTAIEQLVDPPTLARRLLQASTELLGVPRGAVYLREGDPALYRLAGCLGPVPALSELPPGAPLVEALQTRGRLLAGDARPNGFPHPPVLPAAVRQLQFLGGELAHALAHEGQLLALLVLGPKEPGTYGAEDLNLLSAFAQLTALALESAERHRTIEALNHELQAKVEKISEQQRRILALQTQLRQGSGDRSQGPDVAGRANGDQAALPTPDSCPLTPVHGLVGSSPAVKQLLHLVRKVSASESAVLLRGESGTGKGLLAQALHECSPRAGKPFVKVHCAALSPGLLESELFGHVKGAFTGAHRDKVGRFELANGGTLFLDEIGDVSLDVQTKLLRVVQEMTFERVGSSEPVKVNVRLITATHQDLERLMRDGRFREDLYYRLNVIAIAVPPLRERSEDVPELALHFLRQYAQRCGKEVTQLDDDALAVLKAYPWPGNVRELENVLEQAVVLADGAVITVRDLPAKVLEAIEDADLFSEPGDDAPLSLGPLGVRAERAERERRERERLVRALAAARGNKAEAARALGLARSTLVSRLKKYGLS
jgi:transcriptional regulator with GAF, ATPase, and Fis domain